MSSSLTARRSTTSTAASLRQSVLCGVTGTSDEGELLEGEP
ncbi:MAG: hypothetical protein U1E17_12705 [Geminicoccaceae bacterium]